VPENALRPALGAVLLGSALAVVSKAGLYVPVGVIFASPLAVGVVAVVVHRMRGPASRAPAPAAAAAPRAALPLTEQP
jgi:hypothetical protein